MSKNTQNINIQDLVQDYMMSYSAYTLLHRAIPDYRDGLKPSTQRIIYSMYANNMVSFTKSLDVVGTVSKIHAHGSAYPTIVGMCQRDKHHITYLDGNGNIGQHTSRDIQAASDRYTDVRLSQFTKHLLSDNLHKDVVVMGKNYDGTIPVPEVLPVRFPTILTHAQSGIGVGFASNIASYNLNDIAQCVISYIDKKPMPNIIPDFATGGMIIKDVDTIKQINKQGSGSLKIRGKADINKNEISITEIPYTTTREQIIDKVVELAKDELSEVVDVLDLTGKDKMEILVTARRGTDMKILLEKLYQLTPLESHHSSNNMVLVDGLPKQLGNHEIIKLWVEWRKQCVINEKNFDIKKLNNKLFEINILAQLNSKLLDDIIKIVRFTKTKTAAIGKIRKLNDFTYREAEFIYSLRLNQLNSTYLQGKIKEKQKLESQIQELEQDIKNPERIIKQDMNFFTKNYGQARKTRVIDTPVSQKVLEKVQKELVDTNDYWITITKLGYVFKTQYKNDKKDILKTDSIQHQWKLNNYTDEIFTFNHSRDGYKVAISSLELGHKYYLPEILGCDKQDIITYCCQSKYYPIIIQLLTKGRVVKFHHSSFRQGVNVFKNTHTNRFDITNVILLEKEEKIEITDIKGNKDVINTKDIRTTQNRTGTGQYINNKRLDVRGWKIC